MDAAALEVLGLTVVETPEGLEVEAPLFGGQLVNPITSEILERARFRFEDDRLTALAPPELVGLAPVLATQLESARELEAVLGDAFTEVLTVVSRRSSELATLGLSPKVDRGSLVLRAELDARPYRFELVADREGRFSVERASKEGTPLPAPGPTGFELSEFREQAALASYLTALFGEPLDAEAELVAPAGVHFAQVVKAFGGKAQLPPKSSLEVLVELRVGDEGYRFAAARVSGSTFRGLLAGTGGNKVWADRFELHAFEGVESLVARVLDVPLELVEIVG